MNRTEKIKALGLIRQGTPIKFALFPEKFRVLYGIPDSDIYVNADGVEVALEEKEKYLPESVIFINCSNQFPGRLPNIPNTIVSIF